MALAGLLPEERFALDVYNDPTLTASEKLARIQAGMPVPANDDGLQPIPAGPPIDPAATAEVEPWRVKLAPPSGGQMRLDAPPTSTPGLAQVSGSAVRVVDAPTSPLGSSLPIPGAPALTAPQARNVREVAAAPDQFGLNSSLGSGSQLVVPTNAMQVEEARRASAPPGGGASPGTVDPSQVQFGGPGGAAAQAPPRPQFATVGTDTFQPVQRSTRGGFDPLRVEPGAPAEPEFGIEGFEIDPQTGKKVPTGLNVTPGKPNPPRVTDIEGELREAEGEEDQALRDKRAAREYADNAILRQAVSIEDKLRDIEAERAQQENERLRRLQEKQSAFQSVLAEVSDPENPVEAWWGRKDTGDRVMSRLALFFGTLGSAKLGVKNEQFALLQQEIDADIAAQKESKQTKIKGAQTMYDLARDVFESEAARDAAVREAAYARVQRELERFKAFAQTPERQAELDAAIAQADQARKAAEMQRIQATQGETTVVEKFDPKRTVQLGGGKLKDDHRKRLVRLPDGSWAFARDPGRTEKIQEGVSADAAVAGMAARLRRLRALPGAKTDPVIRGQIEGAAAAMFLASKKSENLGTLDKGSLDFRETWQGDPLGLVDFGGADAKLQEVERAANDRLRGVMKYQLDRDPDVPSPVIEDDRPASAQPGAAP